MLWWIIVVVCECAEAKRHYSKNFKQTSYLFVELVMSHIVLGVKWLLCHQHMLPLPYLSERERERKRIWSYIFSTNIKHLFINNSNINLSCSICANMLSPLNVAICEYVHNSGHNLNKTLYNIPGSHLWPSFSISSLLSVSASLSGRFILITSIKSQFPFLAIDVLLWQ